MFYRPLANKNKQFLDSRLFKNKKELKHPPYLTFKRGKGLQSKQNPFSKKGEAATLLTVIAVVLMTAGIFAGTKLSQKRTDIRSKAADNTCWLSNEPQLVKVGTSLYCDVKINNPPNPPPTRVNCTLINPSRSNDSQILTDSLFYKWYSASESPGNTLRFQLTENSNFNARLSPPGKYRLVSYRLAEDWATSLCEKTKDYSSLDSFFGTSTSPTTPGSTSTPQPQEGDCMYISVELNYVSQDKNFDSWVTFYLVSGKSPGPHIQLFRNGAHVAGQNAWNPIPYTYYPTYTGGRISAGQSVSFTGWVDQCGESGTQTSTVTCKTNSNGTFEATDRCRQRAGLAPFIPPTTTPTLTPTSTNTPTPTPFDPNETQCVRELNGFCMNTEIQCTSYCSDVGTCSVSWDVASNKYGCPKLCCIRTVQVPQPTWTPTPTETSTVTLPNISCEELTRLPESPTENYVCFQYQSQAYCVEPNVETSSFNFLGLTCPLD